MVKIKEIMLVMKYQKVPWFIDRNMKVTVKVLVKVVKNLIAQIREHQIELKIVKNTNITYKGFLVHIEEG